MSQGKQAKVLNDKQLRRLLDHVAHSRYPERDRVIVLLSFRAGLRAKEIAGLDWSMVRGSDGELIDEIALTNRASKGKRGGRTIPLHPQLHDALVELEAVYDEPLPIMPVVRSERGIRYTENGIAVWFYRRYVELGFEGASSHSGRRTFITGAARKISQAGGSMRDVQDLAGHASLRETQRYVDVNREAKRRVVEML